MITIVLHPRNYDLVYDVELDGEMILIGTDNIAPEYAAARVMRDRGVTGPFQTTDKTGCIRMTFASIEETAKWTIRESPADGPRRVRWHPFPQRVGKNGVQASGGTDVAPQSSDASLSAK